jgi:hypothetical protein
MAGALLLNFKSGFTSDGFAANVLLAALKGGFIADGSVTRGGFTIVLGVMGFNNADFFNSVGFVNVVLFVASGFDVAVRGAGRFLNNLPDPTSDSLYFILPFRTSLRLSKKTPSNLKSSLICYKYINHIIFLF